MKTKMLFEKFLEKQNEKINEIKTKLEEAEKSAKEKTFLEKTEIKRIKKNEINRLNTGIYLRYDECDENKIEQLITRKVVVLITNEEIMSNTNSKEVILITRPGDQSRIFGVKKWFINEQLVSEEVLTITTLMNLTKSYITEMYISEKTENAFHLSEKFKELIKNLDLEIEKSIKNSVEKRNALFEIEYYTEKLEKETKYIQIVKKRFEVKKAMLKMFNNKKINIGLILECGTEVDFVIKRKKVKKWKCEESSLECEKYTMTYPDGEVKTWENHFISFEILNKL